MASIVLQIAAEMQMENVQRNNALVDKATQFGHYVTKLGNCRGNGNW